MAFHIIVDSCCDLTPKMRELPYLHSVPLTITVGERDFRDDRELNVPEMLDAIADCREAAHTSCPAPAEYLSVFEQYQGDLYVVTLSALLSGSHNSAWQAARLFREDHPDRNIHVFNSCSAASGETLTAVEIIRHAGAGKPFQEVVQEVDRYIREMNTLFVLEDLGTLKKAGRLTRVQALLTGALRVKLVMGSTPEGEICKRGQALSVKQALQKLADIMAEDERHRGKLLCITHADCRDRAERLAVLAKKKCEFSRILITDARGISSFYANRGGVVAAY